VARKRTSISLAEAAALPLILPTGAHGLRQRITAELENRGLTANVVAEIDSLSLLMNCVHDGIGVTIKPMGAVMQEGARGRRWRCLSFSDARLRRRNFLYSLPPERLTSVAAVVTGELKETARELVDGGSWRGFEKITGADARLAAHSEAEP
jgi:LysR family tcuABC transcriptional regulator